jgi:hypothetical protein
MTIFALGINCQHSACQSALSALKEKQVKTSTSKVFLTIFHPSKNYPYEKIFIHPPPPGCLWQPK